MDPAAGKTDLTAHSAEAGTGLVRDVLLGEDAPLDLSGEAFQRIQAVKEVKEDIVLRLLRFAVAAQSGNALSSVLSRSVGLHASDVVQKRGQVQQLCRCERASDRERSECIAKIPVGAKVHIAFTDQELQRSVRLLLGKADVR